MPAKAAPPPPPPVSASPPPPPLRAAPPVARQEAARKSGGGTGLLIGLGFAALLLLGATAVGAWWLLLRKPATVPVADVPSPAVTLPDTTLPAPVPASEPTAVPATPAIDTPAAPATTVPVAPPPTTRAETPGPRGGRTTPVPNDGGPPSSTKGREAPSAASQWAFLDDNQPVEAADGRAMGEAVADQYRSNQGSGSGRTQYGSSGRFHQRERNPRPTSPGEFPAIKLMRFVIDRQEIFHKENRRYGTFHELFAREPLDVAVEKSSLVRGGYRFNMEAGGDGFKITAVPLHSGTRPFVGDDSGFIRAGVE
jgi:hypothetical protein